MGGTAFAQVAEAAWALFLLLGVLFCVFSPADALPSSTPHVVAHASRGSVAPKQRKEQSTGELSFFEDMVAGAFARVAAQFVMYPADALKTLAQVRQGSAVSGALNPALLIKGSITTSAMALPAGAIQFSVFPFFKRQYLAAFPAWFSITFIEMLAAATASLAACVFQTPQEVLKQRIQTGLYPSFASGIVALTQEEGLRGWFTGFLPTVARNMPMVVIVFTSFARLKALHKLRTGRELSPRESMVLGGVAGAVAVGLTNPIDVVKTRLMTQQLSTEAPYRGAADCIQRIVREEGISTFYAGLLPRVVYIAPFSAIQFAVNTKVKQLLLWRKSRVRAPSAAAESDAADSVKAKAKEKAH